MQESSDISDTSQQNIPYTPSQNQDYFKFAGYWTRMIAALLDGIIILVISGVFTFIVQTFNGQSFNLDQTSPFKNLLALISITYNVTFLTILGYTIGKKLMHLRVVTTSYKKIGIKEALIRETIGKILSGIVFGVGYIWISIDKNKQGWHDKIAKTYVVYEQPVKAEEFIESQQTNKQTKKQTKLPIELIIFGILESVTGLIVPYLLIPLFKRNFESSNITGYNPTIDYGLIGLILAMGFVQIACGIFFMIKQRNFGGLNDNEQKIAKILLLVAGLIIAFSLGNILRYSILEPVTNLRQTF